MAPLEGLNGVVREEKEIIVRSKLPDIDIPNHLLLHQYVFQKLPEVSSKPCLINGATGEVLTYSEVEHTARRVGTGLRTLGIKPRDVIMVLLPNCPEFALSFLGASYAGATATTANPFYTPAEISKQVKASNSRLIITHAAYADKVEDHRNDGVLVVCVGSDTETPEGFLKFTDLTRSAESESIQEDGGITPEDVVALPYSSGTTGLPKGVMVTHRGLVTSIAQKVDGENPNMYIQDGDVILCMLPMFHIYALDAILLSTIRAGAAILIMPKYEFESLLELIQRHRVTIAPIAPPVVLEIAKSAITERYDLSSVRAVISGAATLRKELEVAMPSKFPNARFGQGYGMTESGTLASSLAFAKEPFEAKLGSCGTVVRNAEMKIVDPATGVSLNRNQPGEICIRGGQLMKGYLNDPEATAETIDKQGWLHTGDIGYIDEDDELFIVDRIKELIKYKGYQVAPAELETLLTAHSDIVDAAVVGLKDEAAGELPVAFVVRSKESQLTEDDIKLYVSKQVVFYKRIKRVFFVDAIPKAPSGKILRKVLRARLESGCPN